jgi:hypothetical protein
MMKKDDLHRRRSIRRRPAVKVDHRSGGLADIFVRALAEMMAERYVAASFAERVDQDVQHKPTATSWKRLRRRDKSRPDEA